MLNFINKIHFYDSLLPLDFLINWPATALTERHERPLTGSSGDSHLDKWRKSVDNDLCWSLQQLLWWCSCVLRHAGALIFFNWCIRIHFSLIKKREKEEEESVRHIYIRHKDSGFLNSELQGFLDTVYSKLLMLQKRKPRPAVVRWLG